MAKTAISFEETPPDAAEMAARIAATLDAYPYLVAEMEADVVGYAYAGPFRARAAYRWSAETTAYTAEHARRRGVRKALYAALLADLKARGFHTAFAVMTLPNPASERLDAAMGFEPAGVWREAGRKFDRWRDVACWQKLFTPE